MDHSPTSPSAAEATPFSGTERFSLLRRLGVGGMGVVYEAYDQERNMRVALKTLRTLEPHLLLRFKQEFRALQGLQHPNLVTLLELVHDQGHWFFTMELVDGVDLLSWLRGGEPAQPHDRGTFTSAGETNVRDMPDSARDDTVPQLEDDTDRSIATPREAPPQKVGFVAPSFDEARVRHALPQLAAGLTRLHAAGKVHRDIKPSNILVTLDGRVVLLDFGLVTEWQGDRMSESNVVGTVNYMAPEQAAGRRVGPKADWYSVGVILYEVLTGKVPFFGTPLGVMHNKQRREPLPPSRITQLPVPDDLAALCMELLHIDPEQRPDEQRFLSLIGLRAPPSDAALLPSPAPASGKTPFIGRARELALLREAFEAVQRGQTSVVLVDGPSGVGKSALVRQFTRTLEREVPDLVVLTGRYYAREAVPYRALDAIMDAVAHYLMRLPDDAAEAILPIDSGLLAHLFSPLRGVSAVSRAEFRPPALDPPELRARVFNAVRELFIRLARRRPVVLVIDDIQWSDPDSRSVFVEAMRQPDGPTLLAIATHRPEDHEVEVATERALHYFRRVGQVYHLPLGPLPQEEARDLATRLIMDRGGERGGCAPRANDSDDQVTAQEIADEADGHPLFIDALVRHSLAQGKHAPGSVRLDDALGARIDALDPRARQLLELLTLCAGPLPYEEALRAMGGDVAEMARSLATLRTAQLLRATRAHDEDAFEPYHDRVRELTRSRLDANTRKSRHEQLARAMESTGHSDAEPLFTQWRGADNPERAVHYATLAATKASDILAFERASALFAQAIEFSSDADEKRRLRMRHGEALANAGRGRDAARAFMAAVDGSAPHEALELKRRASEQLLRAGLIDQGLEQVRNVLAAVGLSYPSTPRRALASLLWNRFWLRLRGLGYKKRLATEISIADLTRIDVCWSVSGVLGMVDTIRGANFQTLHLRLALKAGEPFRVARALALEAAFSSASGGATAKRTARVLQRAELLCQQVGEPYVLGWVRGVAGVTAALEGRWKAAFDGCAEAETIFREKCGGIAWELSTFQFFLIYSLVFTGRIKDLRTRVPKSAARGRGARRPLRRRRASHRAGGHELAGRRRRRRGAQQGARSHAPLVARRRAGGALLGNAGRHADRSLRRRRRAGQRAGQAGVARAGALAHLSRAADAHRSPARAGARRIGGGAPSARGRGPSGAQRAAARGGERCAGHPQKAHGVVDTAGALDRSRHRRHARRLRRRGRGTVARHLRVRSRRHDALCGRSPSAAGDALGRRRRARRGDRRRQLDDRRSDRAARPHDRHAGSRILEETLATVQCHRSVSQERARTGIVGPCEREGSRGAAAQASRERPDPRRDRVTNGPMPLDSRTRPRPGRCVHRGRVARSLRRA